MAADKRTLEHGEPHGDGRGSDNVFRLVVLATVIFGSLAGWASVHYSWLRRIFARF